jgi:hypothetical protein
MLVNSLSSADPPSENGQGCERAPRTNLLLSATIDAGTLKASVRIRNLSETGALLEGAAFPKVGERLTLRRLTLEIDATVIWRSASRCGVKFEGQASVADWSSGTWSAPATGRDQSRVDRIQAAVRAGSPAIMPIGGTNAAPEEIGGDLDGRVAEELEHLRRLLEKMGDELTDEPIVVQRHPKTVQSFDLACQILGHLAAVLAAENRNAAVDAIGMDDLRARLRRKTMFKGL